jgi:hypothetical protein
MAEIPFGQLLLAVVTYCTWAPTLASLTAAVTGRTQVEGRPAQEHSSMSVIAQPPGT